MSPDGSCSMESMPKVGLTRLGGRGHALLRTEDGDECSLSPDDVAIWNSIKSAMVELFGTMLEKRSILSRSTWAQSQT